MTPDPSFADFYARLADRLGKSAMTVLLYHADDAERLYSSDPDFVPPKGRKRYADAPMMARTRDSGVVQVLDGEGQIAPVIPGWEKLRDIGLMCLVNIPVRDAANTLQGQVNLNLRAGVLSSGDLEDLTREAQALAPLFEAAREG